MKQKIIRKIVKNFIIMFIIVCMLGNETLLCYAQNQIIAVMPESIIQQNVIEYMDNDESNIISEYREYEELNENELEDNLTSNDEKEEADVESIAEEEEFGQALEQVETTASTSEIIVNTSKNGYTGTMGTNGGIQWSYDVDTQILTVTGEDSGMAGDEEDGSPFNNIIKNIGTVYKIVFDECKIIGDASYLFYNLQNLKEIDCKRLDTSLVTDMGSMFSYCVCLEKLNVGSFDTSLVTNMSDMFWLCMNLNDLDVSSFDTSLVTDMSGMFYGCQKLSNLNVNNFDTSQVDNMESMFMVCNSLGYLDVSNFNTSQVTDMNNMFYGCGSLRSLDVSNFDTSQVKNMSSMFMRCYSLISVDIGNFDTSQVVKMNHMFFECKSLNSLDVSSFDTSQVEGMESMFMDCSSLRYLDVSNFNTVKVTNTRLMFYDCSSLIGLDMTGWNLQSANMTYNMFDYCYELIYIKTPLKISDSIFLPEIFYDSQMNESHYIEDCNLNTVITKKTSGIQLAYKNKYYIYIVDSNGSPISGVLVTHGDSSSTTSADGIVQFDLGLDGTPAITAAKEGYITWSNAGSNWERADVGYETIVLYTETEGELKLTSAYYKSDAPGQTNLLTQTKTVTLLNGNLWDLGNGNFTISCTVSDTSAVKEYQLWQGQSKIAVSSDGKFSLNIDNGFVEGRNCFVRVIGQTGKIVDTNINLTFEKNTVNEVSKVSFMDEKMTLKVGDDIPFFGGSTVAVKFPDMLPVDIQLTEDKFYIGFNTDLLSKDEDPEKYFKELKTAMQAAKTNVNRKALQKFIKNNEDIQLPGGKVEAEIIGYAEGDSNSTILKGQLGIMVKAKTPTFGFNTVVWVIPVTVQINATVEGNLYGVITYKVSDGAFDGSLNFDLEVALNAFAGIGIGQAIGVGAFGSGTVGVETRILGQDAGVQKVDLTGTLGTKAYVGIFSYERAWAQNTWHLYTKNSVKAKASAAGSTYAGLYDADNYKVESLDYLTSESEWNGMGAARYAMNATTSFTSLLEGTYRNAQPVMAETENGLYAAFLRGDASTGAVYAAVSKMQDGIWSEPVQADTEAVLDGEPQLLADEEGNVWMAYTTTAAGADITSLLEYAKNQAIVVGKIDTATGAFIKEKEFAGAGYARMQRLALVDGEPALVWLDSSVTDDNSVLVPQESKLYVSFYLDGTWSEANLLCEYANVIYDLEAGDTGFACNMDMDDDLTTTEDRVLQFYDWKGNADGSVSGVTGEVSYDILPGQSAADFIWNGLDVLCSADASIPIPEITNEYDIVGDSIYFSSGVDDSAELFVVKRNEDTTFSEPIKLTQGGRYLENLSVATYLESDIVLGLYTLVDITEDSVNQEKNLVWSIVQPANDLRIDNLEYDTEIVEAGAEVPVTLTVTNAGDHSIEQVNVYVNQELVKTETVALAMGQSQDIVISLTHPSAQEEYTITVEDESGIDSDYTAENNHITITMGQANLSIFAQMEQIGDSRNIVTQVINEGVVSASGEIKLYDEQGVVLGYSGFTDLEKGNVIFVRTSLFGDVEGTTVTVSVESESNELYTYDNTTTVYVPSKGVDYKNYNISYVLNGGTQNKDNPSKYNMADGEIILQAPSRIGYNFIGWYSDECLTIVNSTITAGTTGDIVVYAGWTPYTYTVLFDANTGSGRMESMSSMEYDSSFALTKNTFEKSGYEFAGWNTASDGSGDSFTDEEEVKNLCNVDNGSVTLYAQWEETVIEAPEPSAVPTSEPSAAPSTEPTTAPSAAPTAYPTTAPTDSPSEELQVKSFVERMYTVALGRSAEEGGLNYWTNELTSKNRDGAGLAVEFILSKEFTGKNYSDKEFVDVLYSTFFDRPADEAGNAYWCGELAAGASRASVLSGFVNSQEFFDICNSFGISRGVLRGDGSAINPGIYRFSERLYSTILERTGDKGGIEYWTCGIDDKTLTPEDAAISFFFSEEYTSKNTSDEMYIKTLYRTFMDREADDGGLAHWQNVLNGDGTREGVLRDFAWSPEFKEIMAGYGL